MIKLIKSSFYHEAETKQALADFILNEEILSMNTQCRMFEESFAAKQGRKHAVFVNNGSVANLLLIQSLLNLGQLKKGDRIGFSALTWPTNVMPLIQLGLVPVAIDCELETLNVSPSKLEVRIKGLDGLFLTNVLGFCDDLPGLAQMCEDNSVLLIEDNCESLGSRTSEKLLGNFGQASTFSFFVGHHMSTIEGGMVCTDDDELRDYLVMGRAHGWDRNLSTETQEKMRSDSDTDDFYAKYTFYDLASNFRPTEINGFIGNTQMPYWDEIVEKRISNFHRFAEAMSANDDFYKYELSHMSAVSNFSMPIVCKTSELASKYKDKFNEAKVEIRPVIDDKLENPNSELVHSNGFYFGNNPEMTEHEIATLCSLLEK